MTTMREALEAAFPAINHLKVHQSQCDEEGVFVQVSRQALDETLAAIDAALSAPVAGEEEITRRLHRIISDDTKLVGTTSEDCFVVEGAFAKEARAILQHITPRPALDPETVEALIARLKHCCATMTNDDLSEPNTEKRSRQVERVDTVLAAIEFLESAAIRSLSQQSTLGGEK